MSSDSVDLSSIPLSTRDVRQVAFYLQNNRDSVVAVDISFTELVDENLRFLLPFLASLPKLSTLALNGNRLTLAILKDLTEMLKDPKKFASLAWIDLGNNMDIFTMPQPLLVALRRRCSLKSSLPTIYEYTEGQPYSYHLETSIEEPSHYEEDEEEDEDDEDDVGDKFELEPWGLGEKQLSKDFTLHYCERWWGHFVSEVLSTVVETSSHSTPLLPSPSCPHTTSPVTPQDMRETSAHIVNFLSQHSYQAIPNHLWVNPHKIVTMKRQPQRPWLTVLVDGALGNEVRFHWRGGRKD